MSSGQQIWFKITFDKENFLKTYVAVAITACEVQVSAADSQTIPTVATGV